MHFVNNAYLSSAANCFLHLKIKLKLFWQGSREKPLLRLGNDSAFLPFMTYLFVSTDDSETSLSRLFWVKIISIFSLNAETENHSQIRLESLLDGSTCGRESDSVVSQRRQQTRRWNSACVSISVSVSDTSANFPNFEPQTWLIVPKQYFFKASGKTFPKIKSATNVRKNTCNLFGRDPKWKCFKILLWWHRNVNPKERKWFLTFEIAFEDWTWNVAVKPLLFHHHTLIVTPTHTHHHTIWPLRTRGEKISSDKRLINKGYCFVMYLKSELSLVKVVWWWYSTCQKGYSGKGFFVWFFFLFLQ